MLGGHRSWIESPPQPAPVQIPQGMGPPPGLAYDSSPNVDPKALGEVPEDRLVLRPSELGEGRGSLLGRAKRRRSGRIGCSEVLMWRLTESKEQGNCFDTQILGTSRHHPNR